MNDVVIRADGLGKRYLIGHQSERERYTALRDVVGRSLKGLGRSALDMMRGRQIIAGEEIEEFWALKDVSFEIRRGEVVGIIGRNGAGKSTLLKVLSRITEPTEGRVEIKGRVASLLEVGTGFHPELTGRENIYLNGAILGMSRVEINRKFDEIVAFAEVEKFLDTPVKRYSSGMYVRLAFAVAAHLEPEILVVDEVLAVGDAEFQKKCLGKMKDVAGHGRTVLFVSHNTGAIASLCSKAILLGGGKIVCNAPVDVALLVHSGKNEDRERWERDGVSAHAWLEDAELSAAPAKQICLVIRLSGPVRSPHIGIGIDDSQGHRLATLLSEAEDILPDISDGAIGEFTIKTEPVRLHPGQLYIKISIHGNSGVIASENSAIVLNVPEYFPFPNSTHAQPKGSHYYRFKIASKALGKLPLSE